MSTLLTRREARRVVNELCARLLANPVIEDATVSVLSRCRPSRGPRPRRGRRGTRDGSGDGARYAVGAWRREWVWSFSPGRTASTMSSRPSKALVRRPSSFGTPPPRSARSTRWCYLAASRTATTCAPERSLDFLPSWQRSASLLKAVGPVVGICNGFQVLTEAHLLPGALQKNKGLTFLCQMTELEVVSDRSALTAGVEVGRRLRVPINHFEGNYTASAETLRALEAEGRVVLRYVGNPNGSAHDIAAVCNEGGNVVGLMPHPERASSELLGSSDGLVLLRALLGTAASTVVRGCPSSS